MNRKIKLNNSVFPPFEKGGLGGIFLVICLVLSSCGGGGSSPTPDENISSTVTIGLYGQIATDDEINALLSQLADSTKKSLDSTTASKIDSLVSLAGSSAIVVKGVSQENSPTPPSSLYAAYMACGSQAMFNKNVDVALYCFLLAQKEKHADPTALNNIAFILNTKGEYADAKKVSLYAIEKNKSFSLLYKNLDYSLKNSNDEEPGTVTKCLQDINAFLRNIASDPLAYKTLLPSGLQRMRECGFIMPAQEGILRGPYGGFGSQYFDMTGPADVVFTTEYSQHMRYLSCLLVGEESFDLNLDSCGYTMDYPDLPSTFQSLSQEGLADVDNELGFLWEKNLDQLNSLAQDSALKIESALRSMHDDFFSKWYQSNASVACALSNLNLFDKEQMQICKREKCDIARSNYDHIYGSCLSNTFAYLSTLTNYNAECFDKVVSEIYKTVPVAEIESLPLGFYNTIEQDILTGSKGCGFTSNTRHAQPSEFDLGTLGSPYVPPTADCWNVYRSLKRVVLSCNEIEAEDAQASESPPATNQANPTLAFLSSLGISGTATKCTEGICMSLNVPLDGSPASVSAVAGVGLQIGGYVDTALDYGVIFGVGASSTLASGGVYVQVSSGGDVTLAASANTIAGAGMSIDYPIFVNE